MIAENLSAELAAAEAELRRHMASWEYAFAMGSSCHGQGEHPTHWATRAHTVWVELGFTADTFAAEPTGQVAVDGAAITGRTSSWIRWIPNTSNAQATTNRVTSRPSPRPRRSATNTLTA